MLINGFVIFYFWNFFSFKQKISANNSDSWQPMETSQIHRHQSFHSSEWKWGNHLIVTYKVNLEVLQTAHLFTVPLPLTVRCEVKVQWIIELKRAKCVYCVVVPFLNLLYWQLCLYSAILQAMFAISVLLHKMLSLL